MRKGKAPAKLAAEFTKLEKDLSILWSSAHSKADRDEFIASLNAEVATRISKVMIKVLDVQAREADENQFAEVARTAPPLSSRQPLLEIMLKLKTASRDSSLPRRSTRKTK